MAILKQNSEYYAIYNGWYGDCEQESCESFDLIANKDNIFASYQFTENGVGSSSFSSVVANIAPSLNGFNELNCGKMYYIILSKGTSEIDIPNFVCNNDAMTNDLGKIVKTCQEMPTPTPTLQIIESYELSTNKSEVKEGEEIVVTLKTENVPTGTEVTYLITHPNDVDSDANGKFVVGDDGTSTLTLTTIIDLVNSKEDNVLVSVILTGSSTSSTNWENVTVSFYIRDEKFYETPTPTPTPVPEQTPTPTETPTETPTQTPTPIPAKLEFRWHEISGKQVLQVKNILKPSNSAFDGRDTINNWSSVYAYTGDQAEYSLSHQSWYRCSSFFKLSKL